jgi:glutamate-ammonia-ligase adenylyltransferase
MKNARWKKILSDCADAERAGHFHRLLLEAVGEDVQLEWSEEKARVVAALFSGSESLSTTLLSHPQWADSLDPERLRFPRRKQGFAQELQRLMQPHVETSSYAAGFASVREFHQEQLLRIAARDLARFGKVPDITQELSDLADVCLEGVWSLCSRQLQERYGKPWHQDADGRWHPTAVCVLGLGKLGGQELNYSSDVDLMFVYSEEGQVLRSPPEPSPRKAKPQQAAGAAEEPSSSRGGLTNHQFFNRLAEAFVTEAMRMTPEGVMYRVDLRLRPEGDAGPLSRSLAGYENFYAQWGQTWERMMLIKARGVAGDLSLAAEFLEMVQPFRYPRSINQDALREIGAMKTRIESEVVKPGELERNVKLGRGGIREIEFIAQSLQLLHAGRQPFLQGPQTLPTLAKLVQYELLPAEASVRLGQAYCFLREVEHRLQMDQNRQTHTIPNDRRGQERLARLMGFATIKAFDAASDAHRSQVRALFDLVIKTDAAPESVGDSLPRDFEGGEPRWRALLAEHAFKDLERAFRVLREFVHGPGYVHVSSRTSELALKLIPRLFRLCPRAGTSAARANAGLPQGQDEDAKARNAPLSDPDRVVTRLDSFIVAYGARATLFELWNSNPGIFDLLLRLFDRSEFLAELAIRTPDLVDELVTSGRLRQRKSADETLRDLMHGLADHDQHLWLRRYHQTELMRIGLRDILGLADFEQYLTELSGLADACLRYALTVVVRQNKLKNPPFAIIGLGKLGGVEIDYGSDLDILFVTEAKPKEVQRLSKLALQVMDLVSTRTEHGLLFQTDARLRPDGEKGLLVNTLEAYEDYYRQRAQLWEIQSLTRARPVAGNAGTGRHFQRLAAALSNFSEPSLPLSAYTPGWKLKIHQMRMRIEKERTPRGKDALAIKTGAGGLMDAEFIAQALSLEHGWQEANTLQCLEHARQAGTLPDAERLIVNYRRLRRVEGILRRWSYEGETVLPDDPAPYYRVSVRCGFLTPEAFAKGIAEWRRAIRDVYSKVFAGRA